MPVMAHSPVRVAMASHCALGLVSGSLYLQEEAMAAAVLGHASKAADKVLVEMRSVSAGKPLNGSVH